MKNLVFGTLAAALVAQAGCGGSSGLDVSAHWTFHHADDPAGADSLQCPVGFDTAAVYAQEVDSNLSPIGAPQITLNNCTDYTGIDTYNDGLYLMWVQIENDSGSSVYATSASQLVDTAVDASFSVDIIDDGGYFFFTWSLVDTNSQAALTCDEAGITTGSVESISTDVSDSTYFRNDKFTCTDHYGVTDPLRAGTYTVSFDADQGGAIGPATNKTGTIGAQNDLTDLGHILINID